jgi:hypothetical protein
MIPIDASYWTCCAVVQSLEINSHAVQGIFLRGSALPHRYNGVILPFTPKAQNNLRDKAVATFIQEPFDPFHMCLDKIALIPRAAVKAAPFIGNSN